MRCKVARARKNQNETRKFRDWYDENKKDLLSKKRERYKTDSEYRAAIKERTHTAYNEQNGILENGLRIVTSSGVRFVGYKLVDAALRLGVNIHTLRWYFSSGYLPTLKVDNSSLRVITVDQMPMVAEFIKRLKTENVSLVSEKMMPMLIKKWRQRNGSKKIINKEA